MTEDLDLLELDLEALEDVAGGGGFLSGGQRDGSGDPMGSGN